MATATNEVGSRPLTIGSVCRRLKDEFPDISISKIRFLEDQGLLRPRRTQSGYRLFTEEDVDRLRTILRLQRDEFLPLRVIRQELSAPSTRRGARKRPTGAGLQDAEREIDLAALCEQAGADAGFVRELEEYGLVEPRDEDGEKRYGEGDVDVVAACLRLSRYGIAPRNLRAFRTGADRAAGLLEQIVAPALRSRNAERRHAGLEDLETLAALAHELSQHLFWRAVRSLAAR
jgi:DNA-binding transcriptional MerR regulator